MAVGYANSSGIANASIAGWTLATSTNITPSGSVGIWYKVAGESESQTVTLTWSGTPVTLELHIAEYSGVDTLDKVANVNTTGGAVTSRSSGTTAATTADAEVCVAAVGVGGAVTNVSWSNSFTARVAGGYLCPIAELVTTAAGAQETTASWTTARLAGGLIATFKQTATPPTRSEWFHTGGGQVLDAANNPVTLRGCNVFVRLQNEQAKFNAIAAAGANMVRLSIWKNDVESSPGTLNAGQDQMGLGSIDRAVFFARNAGLRVILDQHVWDTGIDNAPSSFFTDTVLQASWVSMWSTVITRYANDSTVIGVDLMNEPWAPVPQGSQTSWENIAMSAATTLKPLNPNILFTMCAWGPITEPMWTNADFASTTTNIMINDHVYGEKGYAYFNTRYSASVASNIPIWIAESGFTAGEESFMLSQLTQIGAFTNHLDIFAGGIAEWDSNYDVFDASYTLNSRGRIWSEHINPALGGGVRLASVTGGQAVTAPRVKLPKLHR